MYQILEFEEPIPSCRIYSMLYRNNKWIYCYAIETPKEITNDNEEELLIYGYISDLTVKLGKNQHKDSVNIYFKTLDELLNILKLQREADIKFREEWKKQNPDAKIADFATRILENRDYSHKELKKLDVNFVASVIEQKEDKTKFAAI